jgi:hypothetical protein
MQLQTSRALSRIAINFLNSNPLGVSSREGLLLCVVPLSVVSMVWRVSEPIAIALYGFLDCGEFDDEACSFSRLAFKGDGPVHGFG